MADLEAVLADVSYLMAMEKSKSTPAARASKKIILPDIRSVSVIITRWLRRIPSLHSAVEVMFANCACNGRKENSCEETHVVIVWIVK